MADWYQISLEAAINKHDPEKYEERVWEELSLIEQEAAITIAADSLETVGAI